MRDFLARASVAVASTRDADKVPDIHFLSGWSVDTDLASIVCLVPEAFSEGLLDRLARHRTLAMVAEVIGPHECYQFKGPYLDHRAATATDRAVMESCRDRFVTAVGHLMPGRFGVDQLRARFLPPVWALRFSVSAIYVQTPGPAAGHRLYPAES